MPLYPNNRADIFGFNAFRGVGLPHIAQSVPRVWLRANYFVNESMPKTASIPEGAAPYGSLILPITAGGMAASSERPTMSATATAINGGAITGAGTISLTTDGSASIVVGMDGSATLTITGNDALLALTLNMDGSVTCTLTGDASNLAMIVPIGTATGTITLSIDANLKGLLSMSGESTPFEELSPTNLARAVWEALATQYNEAGTMGAKLNSASAAGDPWTADPTAYPDGSAGAALVKAMKALKLGEFIALK